MVFSFFNVTSLSNIPNCIWNETKLKCMPIKKTNLRNMFMSGSFPLKIATFSKYFMHIACEGYDKENSVFHMNNNERLTNKAFK